MQIETWLTLAAAAVAPTCAAWLAWRARDARAKRDAETIRAEAIEWASAGESYAGELGPAVTSRTFSTRSVGEVWTAAAAAETWDGYAPTSWTVDAVRSALAEHERGVFARSALLADHVRRDDRVFATLESRVLGVLALPFAVDVDADTGDEREASDVESWWFDALPESTLQALLRWRIMVGFAVGEVLWRETAGEWRPWRVHVHHPQHVQYDASTRTWWLRTKEGAQEITPGDGRWILLTGCDDRPWMDGAIRAIAVPFLVRYFAIRDWARRSEIEGIGIRKARVPKSADDAVIRRFLSAVSKIGVETTIKVPEGFDVELISTELSAAQGFDALIARCDSGITLPLLGQNLTTQIEGGSYAAATVHARMQLDRIRADVAGMSTQLRDQIVKPWRDANGRRGAPWPRWDATPPEDVGKVAQSLLTLAQALGSLTNQGIDISPVLDRFELTKLAGVKTAAEIFAYHIDAGVVTIEEVRERLGLPREKPPSPAADALSATASTPQLPAKPAATTPPS